MTDTGYQVLARKYRPQTFADLIGQDAMVRTLRNAFEAERIAHAFVMTGVRGIGKTTTARIIAKGLNCIGPAGAAGPTIEPCGACGPCRAIAEGRHVDVLEYDAASNTQVDKMREILASIPYRPTEARYKIIIFDEVHMLSSGSFNALLKTLEEPPSHVKFIFATTEIRKVPVTILSRCQRYDLKRIEPEVMMLHLRDILAREGAAVAEDALALITRAAEGSVRDALSLLDQAIAHSAGETNADQVRAMLGLADRGRVLDLFDLVMKGDAAGALTELGAQYSDGADPMAVLRDLAEVTHWISVIKITPEAAADPTVPPDERDRGRDMAAHLPMPVLTRTWQMLLKILEEIAIAPNAMMAAEMAIIRLTHVADLPDPEKLMKQLNTLAQTGVPAVSNRDPGGGGAGSGMRRPALGADTAAGAVAMRTDSGSEAAGGPSMGATGQRADPSWAARGTNAADMHTGAPAGPSSRGAGTGTASASVAAPAPSAEAVQVYPTFESVVDLIRTKRDMKLLFDVESCVRLARYSPGRIEFEPTPDAPNDLAQRLAQRLQGWTGVRWGVSVVNAGDARTISAIRGAQEDAARARASKIPLVQAVLAAFPCSVISEIRTAEARAQGAAIDALPEVEDEWDPFEDQ